MTAMTTTTTSPRSIPQRIGAAFRLHFVNRQFTLVPLAVFVAGWAVGVAIGFGIHQSVDGAITAENPMLLGASQAALWTLLIYAGLAASNTFAFALALSFSRRTFMAGTAGAFLVMSLGFGGLFALAALVEQATDGFGVHAYSFALPFLLQQGVVGAGILAAAVCLVAMLLGFGFAMLYRRVTVLQLWIVILALVLIIAAAAILVTAADRWPTVLGWFAEQSTVGLAAWLLLPAALLAVVDYLLIRRAAP